MTGQKINKDLNHALKTSLKELFGREWANKLAERTDFSRQWVRRCLSGNTMYEEVFQAGRSLVKETIAEREEQLKDMQS